MYINPRPNIVATVNTEDGYLVRTLCLVDGLPAQVEIEVDTHRQKYSSYAIHVYNADRMEWAQRIHSLRPNEVGRMPILGDDAETLVALNRVADLLWQGASLIVRTARERMEELNAQVYEQLPEAIYPQTCCKSDESDEDAPTEMAPLAACDHGEAEFAVDLSSSEVLD